MKKNQNIIFIAVLIALVVGLFFISPDCVFATYDSSADNADSILNNPFAQTNITDFFEAVIENLQGIIAFLAVCFIVIGGILYITAGGSAGMLLAAKICIVGAILGLALAAGGPSFLQQIRISVYGDLVTPIPNDLGSAPTVREIVARVISFLLSIVGMLAIIGLTISGIMYLFAGGDSTQAENAKRAMKYSIIGIIFAGAALILVIQIIEFFA
jgi:hypothetical protein